MFPGVHAATRPGKPAIIQADTGRVVTYGELDDRSPRFAQVLRAAGLRRGDHVAFLSDNAPEVFEVYWAALRSGLYVTGINHHLTRAEASYVINDRGARALVVSSAQAELAVALIADTSGVELRFAFGGPVEGHDRYEDALDAASGEPLPSQPRGADMLYSSGTTGRPKGVKPALPDHQVDEPGDVFTAVFGQVYGFGPDTVYYSPAPVYHAAPLRFGGIVHAFGGTLVRARTGAGGRAAGVRPRPDRPLQGSTQHRLHRRPAPRRHRKTGEVPAPGPVPVQHRSVIAPVVSMQPLPASDVASPAAPA